MNDNNFTYVHITHESYTQKIRKWFYNNYQSLKHEYFRFSRKWSARSVYFHKNRALVLEQTTKTSGLSSGQPGFASALQIELSNLWKELSFTEQDEYQTLASEWSVDKPPQNVQARSAPLDIIQMLSDI